MDVPEKSGLFLVAKVMQTTQPDFFNSNLLETVFARLNFANHEIRWTCQEPVRALLKNIWTKTLEESNLLVFLSFAMEHVQEGNDGKSLKKFYFFKDKYSEILYKPHRITIR